MIRVGLVGFGLAGRVFHAPIISAVEGLELAAVVERTTRNAQAAYPEIATYPSLQEMLTDPGLELIVVATPNSSHAPLAKEALEAGRHVVVDKPLAPTSAEIASLMLQADRASRLLIPFHNRRFDMDFQTIQQLLHEEKLGRIVALESTFDRWRPIPKAGVWREAAAPGTGILLDLGTHLIDQALVLFGLPAAVSADVSHERDGAVADDSFAVRLRYERLLVSLSANCLAAIPRPRYTARGTQASYVKWGLDPQEALLRENARVIQEAGPGWANEPASAWGSIAVGVDDATVAHPVPPVPVDYHAYYSAVRDALLNQGPPPVSALDAWRVARIAEWAIESSQQRREIPCDWSSQP